MKNLMKIEYCKHEKQMWLSSGIMSRNPIITAHGDYKAEFLY